jgi:hypothetical protein
MGRAIIDMDVEEKDSADDADSDEDKMDDKKCPLFEDLETEG